LLLRTIGVPASTPLMRPSNTKINIFSFSFPSFFFLFFLSLLLPLFLLLFLSFFLLWFNTGFPEKLLSQRPPLKNLYRNLHSERVSTVKGLVSHFKDSSSIPYSAGIFSFFISYYIASFCSS